MEKDKIPQETSIAQAPLENKPVHKNLLNQKGSFLLILGAVVIILVMLGAGIYLLTIARTKNQFVNTTLGLTLNLPDGWTACESGDADGRIRVGKNQICKVSWEESYIPLVNEFPNLNLTKG